LLLLFATACGAEERVGDKIVEAHAIEDVQLIENCEDGNDALIADEEVGIVGYWYSYDDRQECEHPNFVGATPMSVQCGAEACAAAGDLHQTFPPTRPYGGGTDIKFTMTEYPSGVSPGGEGEQKNNNFGLKLTGGDYEFFGAGVGVGVNNPAQPQQYNMDENGFVGLRFLAKSGIAGKTLKLRVKIKDVYSEPLGMKCLNRENVCEGSTCVCKDTTGAVGGPTMVQAQGCHDDPLAPAPATTVTDQWQVFEIPFSDFVREDWSTMYSEPPPSANLVTSAVYQIQFQVNTDATPATQPLEPFELWLDNIGLMTKLPETPTGMVMPPPEE
jgi:hypothetical protein